MNVEPTGTHTTTVTGAICQAARMTGADFQYLLATAQVESNLNPNAQTPTSSARGAVPVHRADLARDAERAGHSPGLRPYANFISRQPSGDYWVSEPRMSGAVVILRSDPTANSLMAGASTKANAGKLAARLGRDPSEGELYIAHFLGPTGASRLIGLADTSPLTPAATVFPTAARANPTIFYEGGGNTRSASEVYRFLVGRYDVARGGPEKATTVAVNASESAPAQNAFTPGTAGLAETYAAAARGEVGSVLQQPAQAVGGCGHFRISERAGIALDVVGGEDNSWRVCLDRPLLLTLRRARQAGRIRRASMPRSHRRSWPAPPRRGRPVVVAGHRRPQQLAQLSCVWGDDLVVAVGDDIGLGLLVIRHFGLSPESPSPEHLCFIEQRMLADDIGLAALAPLGADVVRVGIAPPVRPEIGFGLNERRRIGDHVDDTLVERLGRDRLGQDSVTPASRAAVPRSFSVWPVTMMIGTNGLALAPGCRFI